MSKSATCDRKKSKFIKELKACGLLNSFSRSSFKNTKKVNTSHKMNEIGNNFLLAGDKFMREIHLRQPGFTCSASVLYIYQNKLNKTSFRHDVAYGDCKGLARRTASDKIKH